MPGEGDSGQSIRPDIDLPPNELDRSPARFDAVLRGLLLVAWVFPRAVDSDESVASILRDPGPSFLQSMRMGMRSYDWAARNVRGLLGGPSPVSAIEKVSGKGPQRNDRAIDDLLVAQGLVEAAIAAKASSADDWERFDLGLDMLEPSAIAGLDDVLRSNVHRRMIWLGDFEYPDEPGLPVMLRRNGGAFATEVPESLVGLVAADLADTIARGWRVGECALCHRALELPPSRYARWRKGQPVYHDDCREDGRRDYFKRRHADRRPLLPDGS